jgi:hypothetical protein
MKTFPPELRKPKSCVRCQFYSTYSHATGFCSYLFPTEKLESEVLWKGYTRYVDIFVNIRPKDKCPNPKTREESSYWFHKIHPGTLV